MELLNFVDEDFTNYYKPAMFFGMPKCDGKCWKDLGLPKETCQNYMLYHEKPIIIDNQTLITRYLSNKITSSIVFGGLEPLLSIHDIMIFLDYLRNRNRCDDDVIIYTGYREDECEEQIKMLSEYKNIVVKFGRYIPNAPSRYDEVLRVKLVSDNQYAKQIS